MSTTAQPFDFDAAEGSLRPIIRYKPGNEQQKEMVEAAWGSDPRFSDGLSYRFIRSEGKTFPDRRCLIPVSDFRMQVGTKRYRVSREDGNFFYLAGVWEPAMGDWPLSFRIITVDANSDVALYQDRHGAMIERGQVMKWLDHSVPEDELLMTPPPRIFLVEKIGASGKRTAVSSAIPR